MKTLKRLISWSLMVAMVIGLVNVNMINAWAANESELFTLEYPLTEEGYYGKQVNVDSSMDLTGKNVKYAWYRSNIPVTYESSNDFESLTTIESGVSDCIQSIGTGSKSYNLRMNNNDGDGWHMFAIIEVEDTGTGENTYYRTASDKITYKYGYDKDELGISYGIMDTSATGSGLNSLKYEFKLTGASAVKENYDSSYSYNIKPNDTLKLNMEIDRDYKEFRMANNASGGGYIYTGYDVKTQGERIDALIEEYGEPTIKYQWYSTDDGEVAYSSVNLHQKSKSVDTLMTEKGWEKIESANSNTYTVQKNDVYKYLCCVVEATGILYGRNMFMPENVVSNIETVTVKDSDGNVSDKYFNGTEFTYSVEFYDEEKKPEYLSITWLTSDSKDSENWNRGTTYQDNLSNNADDEFVKGFVNAWSKTQYAKVEVKEPAINNISTDSDIIEVNPPKNIQSATLSTTAKDSLNAGDKVNVGETISISGVTVTNENGIEEIVTDDLESKFNFTWYKTSSVSGGVEQLGTGVSYVPTNSDTVNSGFSNLYVEVSNKTNEFTGMVQTVKINVVNDSIVEIPITVTLTDKNGERVRYIRQGENLILKVEPKDATYMFKKNIIVNDVYTEGEYSNESTGTYTYNVTDSVGSKIFFNVKGTGNYVGGYQNYGTSTQTVTVIGEDEKLYTAKVINSTNPSSSTVCVGDTAKVVVTDSETKQELVLGTDFEVVSWGYAHSAGYRTISNNKDTQLIIAPMYENGQTIKELTATVRGLGEYAKLDVAARIKITEKTVAEDKLTVTDSTTGKTDPSSTKPGNTLVAELPDKVNGIPSSKFSYTWYVEGKDEPIGTGKEIILTEDIEIGSKVYVVASYLETTINSAFITVKDNVADTNNTECNVIVSQGQSFKVTIPAFVSLDGKKNDLNQNKAQFNTVVVADIAGKDSIEVKPACEGLTFKMEEAGGIKKALDAVIEGDDKGWIYKIGLDDCTEDSLSSDEGVVRTHTITVSNLSAGRWTGTFDWRIVTTGNKIDDSEEYVKYKTYKNESGKMIQEGDEVKVPDDAKETPWE